MRPRDRQLGERIRAQLIEFDRATARLPGVAEAASRDAFCEQLLESIHRLDFVQAIRQRRISDRRADPADELFDPLRAAILQQRRGQAEEAFWLVFLFVHFGKNRHGGWRYAREIYGRLGDGRIWDWASTSHDPAAFRRWLHEHQEQIARREPPGGFGNHRKYEKLDADSDDGTGAVVETYVEWVSGAGSHALLIANALTQADGDPEKAFDVLYHSMKTVRRFGRLARFDYLTMVAKIGLAQISPGSPYLEDANSGPVRGAKLIFGSQESPVILDGRVTELGQRLGVPMQVMEDALCNWQKSPQVFVPFRG